MSDTNFYGVLKMPYEMAMQDELSRRQFYLRVQEAVERLESAPSWQGLSDDEMMEIWCSDEVESTLDFGRAIEAKLKEKNT